VLYGFTISNFRNFGRDEQWISPLGRVNIFVGTNNSGKSNVLRYIKRVVAQTLNPQRGNTTVSLQPIDRPVGGGQPERVRFWATFPPVDLLSSTHTWQTGWTEAFSKLGLLDETRKFIQLEVPTSGISGGTFYTGPVPKADQEIQQAFYRIWSLVTSSSGGGFDQHWFREVINRITAKSLAAVDCYYIPSFRHIPTRMGDFADEFSSATGDDHLIDRLAGLAYPSYTEQKKKEDFEKLRRFVATIIDDPEVVIEIPADRQTVNVRTSGSFLPIEALGSGIHEVFILASEIVSRPYETILLEEPEAHLHPTLQRRLMQFIMEETTNQIFITTHSATVIDTPGSQLFEIRNEDGAHLRPITTGQQRFTACRELGFRASDLIQTNAVVWVEGPSDRIYVKAWLKDRAPHLEEGLHYSIMFYGGKLLSHLTAEDESLADFIQLLPICRSPSILIDSDKSGGNSNIRTTKLRIAHEFETLEAPCWITSGREIENYYSYDDRLAAVQAVHENVANLVGGRSRYDKPITFTRSGSSAEIVADKIAIANYLTEHAAVAVEVDEFSRNIDRLVTHITQANS
jgi:hypothetical protein